MIGSTSTSSIHAIKYVTVSATVLLILLLGVTPHGAAQSEPKTYVVTIKIGASLPNVQGNQPSYEPNILPPAESNEKGIPVGSTVTWINEDESYHTVTSGDALTGPNRIFDSGILSPKVKWPWTFDIPGQYDYYCTVHPFMSGQVKVIG